MNSVMTAGLHHRWRERAADLARVGPGLAALDVAAAPATWRSSWRARGPAAGRRLDFSERDARAGAREKAPGARRFEEGDALELPYADGSFDAVTVGFGARNFADLDRGPARDGARRASPAGAWWCSRSRRRSSRRCRRSSRLWFDRVVPLLGRVAGDPDAYTYLPELACKRFPGPQELGARDGRAPGCDDVRWILTAGGIIAIHCGTRAG